MALTACQRALAPGTLIVGSSATGVPFSFIDPRTNALTGAMVDIMHAVANAVGMRIDLQTVPFAALIPSLTARKIDIIAAAMVKTEARERVVAFTDPVYAYGGGLAVRTTDPRAPRSWAELKRSRVGAQVGTVFVTQLEQVGVTNVAIYDSISDILRDLEHGRIDAGYCDAPILAYQLRINPRPALRMVEDFRPPAAQDVCLIVRRNDPLIARLNRAIATTKTNTIAASLRRWQLDKAGA